MIWTILCSVSKITNNGSVSTTDDKSYLGVQISGLTADLIGLESILEFHATAVNVKVNKATDTDNKASTTPSKLDWDSLATSGMTLASLVVDSALDVHADGTVALNALSGVLVAKGSFDLDLGQVSTTAPSNGVSFTNASPVSLTLANAASFTVSLWFNPYLLTGSQQIIAGKSRYSLNERHWGITIEPDGKLRAHLKQKGWSEITCDQPLQAGHWHDEAFVGLRLRMNARLL